MAFALKAAGPDTTTLLASVNSANKISMIAHALFARDKSRLSDQSLWRLDPAMTIHPSKPVRPADQLAAGKAYFSERGLDVSHFGAIWHLLKVGQLMGTDLNQISRRHGLSIADFHLLSALMMNDPVPVRATDLASALNVSNAALSGRVRRLAERGLLTCTESGTDRRTKLLLHASEGAEIVHRIGSDLEQVGRFVHHYRQLPLADREELERIIGQLHTMMDRDFLPVTRGGWLRG